MLLSRKWLSEFVDVDANDKEFAEAMTLSGSKVEVTEDLGAEISNVVVGRVLSMERHPDSDHMWVCQVDVAQDQPVQIVTGAWNVHVGDLVPVALHKSTLPGGKKIEKGKLRGVESNGMLCGLDLRPRGGGRRQGGHSPPKRLDRYSGPGRRSHRSARHRTAQHSRR